MPQTLNSAADALPLSSTAAQARPMRRIMVQASLVAWIIIA
jgi:hypothetical protein